ncbi:MAG: hypothetical protein WA003_01505 [Desulfuromonadaceae bacterium]
MKIKIENVFAAVPDDSVVIINGIQDDKNLELKPNPNEPNLTIRCKTKDGFPCFINMPKTACLAVSFLKDDLA